MKLWYKYLYIEKSKHLQTGAQMLEGEKAYTARSKLILLLLMLVRFASMS